jgi:sugar lactone lactonase YvrE
MAVGPDGRIYVLDSGNHRVQVFDELGQVQSSWGASGTEPGLFNEPWGIAVDESHVYVADTWNHRIQKFSLDGEFVASFGMSGSATEEADGLGLFFGPRSIILTNDDQLLVTDTGNHRMQLLDKDGNFLQQFGSFGNLLGQMNEPVGLGQGPDGSIYLADTWNSRVQQFSPDWPVDAWEGTSINNKPYTAVDSAGRVYVTDPEGYRVLVFNPDGTYLARFGTFGTGINNFGLPNGIAIDSQDYVYIADSGNNRILKFAPVFGPVLSLDTGEEAPLDNAGLDTAGEELNRENKIEPAAEKDEGLPTAAAPNDEG